MFTDRYRIVGRLGKGGMGEVYRADDLRLGQPVALKFLPPEIAGREEMLARYHHEVRIARQVSHPNVCRVYDIGNVEGDHYISMEYVDGEDLRVLLRRIGRIPGDKAVQIARQLCAGLAAAHDKGVLHRDLKPANVMLDAEGRVRITDFGLAAIAGEIRPHEIRSGTPTYMAPEQLAGKEVSVASDIYALGLVLHEVFTGKPVYQAGSLAELRRKHEEEPTSPSNLVEDLDPSVERAILRCLSRHPTERPTSALAVAAALPGGDPVAAALAAGETPSPEMVAAVRGEEGQRPALSMGLLAVALAGLALGLFIVTPASLTGRVPLPKPPEVLAQEARDLLDSLGHTGTPGDSFRRFDVDDEYLDHIEKQDVSTTRWDRIETDRPGALTFWYRQSPRPLAPFDTSWAAVTPEDPPATISGMAFVRLDPGGRLLGLEVVPPQFDETQATAADPDWTPLLSRAGVDAASLAGADPQWTPPVHCDRRSAWTAKLEGPEAVPVRIEAGAWRGKPIYFAMILPWTAPTRMEAEEVSMGERIANVLGATLFLILPVGVGLFLARRNLRMGRCDRKGAFRLATFYVVAHMMVWIFTSKHVADFQAELGIFMSALGGTLFQAMLLYVVYIALEPYVRRRWPTTLTSWTRALAGRFRDPRVAGDILVGIAGGGVLNLIFHVGNIAPAWLGQAPGRPNAPGLVGLTGSGPVLGNAIDQVVHAQVPAMAILFIFLLLRIILRKAWIAATVLTLVIVLLSSLGSDNPLINGGTTLVAFPLVLFTLTRFGLLAMTSMFYTMAMLSGTMLTADFSSWLAGPTIVALLVLTGLVLYGFYTSLAGRAIFATDLFRE